MRKENEEREAQAVKEAESGKEQEVVQGAGIEPGTYSVECWEDGGAVVV